MDKILPVLLQLTAAGSAAICLVLLGRLLLRKAPGIFSYALWSVVLFRLLIPAGIPVTYPKHSAPIAEYLPLSRVPVSVTPPLLSDPGPVHGPLSSAPAPELSLHLVFTLIWLAGALIMVLYGIFSYLKFRKQLTGACRIHGNLYEADYLPSAFVAGFFRPKIYLPSGLSFREQTYIAAHERCHIHRLDHVTRPLAYLALSIHWYNPLVWLAFYLAGRDMEMSCDEAVLNQLGMEIRADYASSLLALVRPGRIPGVPLAFGESNTKVRIQNMAVYKPAKSSVRMFCGLIVLLLISLCACQPKPAEAEAPADSQIQSQPYGLPDGMSFRDGSQNGCTVYSGETKVGGIFLLDITPEQIQLMPDGMDLDQWYQHLKPGMPDIQPGQYDCMGGSDIYYDYMFSYANREKEYVHYVFSLEDAEAQSSRSYSLSLDRSKISSKQEKILVDAVTQLARLNEGMEPEPTVDHPPLEFKNVTDHSADIYEQDGLCGGILRLELTPEDLKDPKKLEAAIQAISRELDPSPFVDYSPADVPSYADYEATYVTERGFTEHYIFSKNGICYDLWFDTLSVWLDSKYEAVELVLAS